MNLISNKGIIRQANVTGLIRKELVLEGTIQCGSLGEMSTRPSKFTLIVEGATGKRILKKAGNSRGNLEGKSIEIEIK